MYLLTLHPGTFPMCQPPQSLFSAGNHEAGNALDHVYTLSSLDVRQCKTQR